MQDIMFRTGSDNVIVDKETGKTLATYLAELALIADTATTPAEVDAKISAAIDALIDGAPATYDTLKEIAAYIQTDQSAMEALNASIATKVDKVEGKTLTTNDFTNALLAKLEAIAEGATKTASSTINGNIVVNGSEVPVYTHPTTPGNKHIPAGGEADQVLTYGGSSGTAAWALPKVFPRIGVSTPDDLSEGELFIKILEDE